MRRVLGLLAVAQLALAALLLQSAITPRVVLACSCAEPQPIAEYGRTGENTIVVGTIGQPEGDITPILVDSWYVGQEPSDLLWVRTGSGDEGMCEYSLVAGERRFLVLHGPPGGLYSTNICLPSAPTESDDGARLMAEAQEAFGAPVLPPPAPSPTPAPERPLDLSPFLGQGLIWIVGGVGAAVVLFLALGFMARRRRLS